MNRIISYIKFLIKSKNEHGVHSPFVFNLITKAIYNKKIDTNFWSQYYLIKKRLKENHSVVNVSDFGAGSKKLALKKRSVSQIVTIAGISNKRAKILHNLVTYLQPKIILEIGTSLGLSTTVLSLSQPNSTIYTVEGCKNTLDVAKNTFDSHQLNNIKTKVGEFDKVLPSILENKKFDLVFIDGNHTEEATKQYFELLLGSVHNDSCLIFDDIYWSKGMEKAWKYIIKHPKVTVSIDTYQWGIVFFRKEQKKEHFTIRV